MNGLHRLLVWAIITVAVAAIATAALTLMSYRAADNCWRTEYDDDARLERGLEERGQHYAAPSFDHTDPALDYDGTISTPRCLVSGVWLYVQDLSECDELRALAGE